MIHTSTIVIITGLMWSAVPPGGPGGDTTILVAVRTIDREEVRGSLEHLDLDVGMILRLDADTEQLHVPSDQLVSVRRLGPVESREASTLRLDLVGGDRLYGRITGSAPDHIVVDSLLGARVGIPLERTRAVLAADAWAPRWHTAVHHLLSAETSEDQVLLSNGDVIRGFIDRVEPDRFVIDGAQEMVIGMDLLIAAALANDPTTPETGLHARLEFADGSLLTATRMRWTSDVLGLTCFDGSQEGLAPEDLTRVEIRGGRWHWLAESVPQAFEHTPQMSLSWPLQFNRNVLGSELRLAGRTYAQGLGMHSESRVRFALDGHYREFVTVCGLDDSAGSLADVTAAIIVDDKTLWRREDMRADTPPERLRIDVSGARQLELVVEFGANGGVQDYFDWADAALIR